MLPSLVLGATGLLVIATSPWLFGQQRWVQDDPASYEHVFTLAAHRGQLYRGTQEGTLWVHDGAGWRPLTADPAGRPIMTVLPDRTLAVLTDGLWDWSRGRRIPAPDGQRLAHAVADDKGLLVATGGSVYRVTGEDWQDLGLAGQVYRVLYQRRAEGGLLHVGTIAAGAWRRDWPDAAGGWQRNDAGLPRPVNVLSLLEAGNGAILAGTDQGLYWQPDQGQRWRRIDDGLGGRRVLALALDEQGRLWAGSDDGVYVIQLIERERALETQGRWEKLANPPGGLERPVSWVVPIDGRIWISAGSVYRLGHVAGPYLYQQLAIGVLLMAAALYLLRRRGNRRGDAKF